MTMTLPSGNAAIICRVRILDNLALDKVLDYLDFFSMYQFVVAFAENAPDIAYSIFTLVLEKPQLTGALPASLQFEITPQLVTENFEDFRHLEIIKWIMENAHSVLGGLLGLQEEEVDEADRMYIETVLQFVHTIAVGSGETYNIEHVDLTLWDVMIMADSSLGFRIFPTPHDQLFYLDLGNGRSQEIWTLMDWWESDISFPLRGRVRPSISHIREKISNCVERNGVDDKLRIVAVDFKEGKLYPNPKWVEILGELEKHLVSKTSRREISSPQRSTEIGMPSRDFQNIDLVVKDSPFSFDCKKFSQMFRRLGITGRQYFSRSSLDFIQLLTEDFHLGVVLEIPITMKAKHATIAEQQVRKTKGTSWILMGPHGSLAVCVEPDSVDISTHDESDDESPYIPEEII
mmetsp:Transcript_28009/g.64873  ORF Transcript_28009/g.64873 Transcript_28009/m.64873 type:complete len:404 (-) Transcript_28009:3-1214(-)